MNLAVAPAETSDYSGLCCRSWIDRVHTELHRASYDDVDAAVRAVMLSLRDILPARETLALAGAMPQDARRWLTCYEPGAAFPQQASESLVGDVAAKLPRGFPHHACEVVRAVLAALAEEMGTAAATSLMRQMPPRQRKLWPRAVWDAA